MTGYRHLAALAAAALLAGCAQRGGPPRTITLPAPPPCNVALGAPPVWAPPAAPADARERLAATLAWGAEWRADATAARAALAACGGRVAE